MHNNIMAAGSKDRPPMLGPEDIPHWRSLKKEAIFLLLTGIGDEIYSTVDACNTANEMWTAIERLQQGESLNIQDVKTNLFWEFGKFTSRDGESMESYYSRFYKLMNELTRNNLQVTTMQVNVQFLQQLQPEWSRFVTVVKQSKEIDTISYHTLFDILKQYQNEVNDIRAERIAKSANPLALLAAAQPYSDNYYQAPKPQRTNTTSSSTRPSASTRHKGKEIAKPVTPQSESVSEEDSDPEQAQRDKDMQKNLALLAKYFKKLYKPTNNNLRTSSNSRNKTEDTTPKESNKQSGKKTTRITRNRMMRAKAAEHGVPLQAEQADWLADTDEEIDEQELEAHYSFMAKIQEVLPEESSSTDQPLEQKDDSNVTPDSSNICNNDNQVDQNAAECVDERVALANLIANLTLDTEENKMILKQLKKANASLTQELKTHHIIRMQNLIRQQRDICPLKSQVHLRNQKDRSPQDIGKLLNSCTGKVDSEPAHGSRVDIPHIHACKQTLGLSAADQASVFMAMMSVHISSGLVLHQMTSDHNRSELGIHSQVQSCPSPSVDHPADKDAPSPSNSQTTPETEPPVIPNDVEEDNHDIEVAHHRANGLRIHHLKHSQMNSQDQVFHSAAITMSKSFLFYDAFLSAVEPKTYNDSFDSSLLDEAMQKNLRVRMT
ncbi:hypothetical protein Tco_0018888 [Tanacetum coccineum]